MKLFKVYNQIKNECKKPYHFLAKDITEAKKFMKKFVENHNRIAPETEYLISFEAAKISSTEELAPGFFNLDPQFYE